MNLSCVLLLEPNDLSCVLLWGERTFSRWDRGLYPFSSACYLALSSVVAFSFLLNPLSIVSALSKG